MKGKLIVIEGLDGSGKSTQIELIKKRLNNSRTKVKSIKLPCYESQSSSLVKMYLDGEFGKNPQDVNAYAASSFYAVDRFASYKTIWKDDYENGIIILADRYTTSNAYHQMNKLPESKWDEYLEWLEEFEYEKIGIPKPDLVIYLDMPLDISQLMLNRRYDENSGKKDVHESNIAYLEACRKAAFYAGRKMGWKFIDCADGQTAKKREEILEEIMAIVDNYIKE